MVVQRQVNAYNARDIEAFAAAYAPDVRIYSTADSVQYSGRDRLFASYKRLFENAPDLHAEIVDRLVLGDLVIDHERVKGLREEGFVEAAAIYRVNDKGLIQEVRFVFPQR